MDPPVEFSDGPVTFDPSVSRRKSQRSESPEPSGVSVKSNRSMDPPIVFSDRPVTSDPRCCHGDVNQNGSSSSSDLSAHDSRFITDKPDGKWIGKSGVILSVTDLHVESPERVTEGDSVRLTCKSSCTLTDRATFIWYRNSQPLTERRDRNNELLLQSVRREDAGRYSCAVPEDNYISPAVYLNVMYPPQYTFAWVSPCCEIVAGDSVTLNCSSDSNPPAEISWFKGGTFVGSGRIFNISKISSDDSGEYKCKSINEHGEKYSDAVTLKITSVGCLVILCISIGVVCGAVVITTMVLIWGSRMKKRNDTLKSQMNQSKHHYNRRKACDVELSQPVYENAAINRKRP